MEDKKPNLEDTVNIPKREVRQAVMTSDKIHYAVYGDRSRKQHPDTSQSNSYRKPKIYEY